MLASALVLVSPAFLSLKTVGAHEASVSHWFFSFQPTSSNGRSLKTRSARPTGRRLKRRRSRSSPAIAWKDRSFGRQACHDDDSLRCHTGDDLHSRRLQRRQLHGSYRNQSLWFRLLETDAG